MVCPCSVTWHWPPFDFRGNALIQATSLSSFVCYLLFLAVSPSHTWWYKVSLSQMFYFSLCVRSYVPRLIYFRSRARRSFEEKDIDRLVQGSFSKQAFSKSSYYKVCIHSILSKSFNTLSSTSSEILYWPIYIIYLFVYFYLFSYLFIYQIRRELHQSKYNTRYHSTKQMKWICDFRSESQFKQLRISSCAISFTGWLRNSLQCIRMGLHSSAGVQIPLKPWKTFLEGFLFAIA